jgi:hypothetical protein
VGVGGSAKRWGETARKISRREMGVGEGRRGKRSIGRSKVVTSGQMIDQWSKTTTSHMRSIGRNAGRGKRRSGGGGERRMVDLEEVERREGKGGSGGGRNLLKEGAESAGRTERRSSRRWPAWEREREKGRGREM